MRKDLILVSSDAELVEDSILRTGWRRPASKLNGVLTGRRLELLTCNMTSTRLRTVPSRCCAAVS